mmetsp:Transcript_42041/g.101069  ORF Transcript_42041/g.101069 Transcript_42041/m.101069 type:complete len:97 (-) Transcript_42041:2901-3191(-)
MPTRSGCMPSKNMVLSFMNSIHTSITVPQRSDSSSLRQSSISRCFGRRAFVPSRRSFNCLGHIPSSVVDRSREILHRLEDVAFQFGHCSVVSSYFV